MKIPRIPGHEVDYWQKLSPEERAWLKQFNDEFVNGYFSKRKKPLHGKKQKLAIERSRHGSRRDAYARWRGRPFATNDAGSQTPDLETAVDSVRAANLADFLPKTRR